MFIPTISNIRVRTVISAILFIGYVSAIPSIAVPDMIYNNSIDMSTNYDNTNNSQMQINSRQIRTKLPSFNADVRGAIINSGQFKLVQLPAQVWKGDTQAVLDYIHKLPKSNRPDYVLLGNIASVSQDENQNILDYTDKITKQYNISIAVDYQLIKTSDSSVMAGFTALGQAGDAKILNASSPAAQKITHNIPLLVQQASKNLGLDVANQLNSQFGISSSNYNNDSKVITDVKSYD